MRREVSALTFWLAVGLSLLLAVGAYFLLRARQPEAGRYQLPARPAVLE